MRKRIQKEEIDKVETRPAVQFLISTCGDIR